jgi:hypothetical protein
MAATVIQSTAASRPRRAANSWLTSVEKVLLIRPRAAAATQRERLRDAISGEVLAPTARVEDAGGATTVTSIA